MNREDILKLSNDQQLNYWLGCICMAVGSGTVRATLYQMVDFYLQAGYERGRHDALAERNE